MRRVDSSRMKRLTKVYISVALAFALSATPWVANAASTAGGSCSKAGQTTVINGKKLTCSLIWVASGNTTSAKPKSSPSSKIGIAQSKDFALISIQFSNDSLGDAQATARIQNTSSVSHGGFFNITIFRSDGVTPAVNLIGVASGVSGGETQTVSFETTDGALPTGQFKYAFQTSTEL